MKTLLLSLSPGCYRHLYLLASLLVVIAVRPFFSERILGRGLLEGILFITIIAGAYAVAISRRTVLLLTGLGLLSMLMRIAWFLQPNDALLYGFLSCYMAFYSVVAALLMNSLFQAQDRISMDTLNGAVSVYLILGLLWAMAYAVLELASPGSFRFGAETVPVGAMFERFLGFSFTTLTTLGYGNIAPATPQADALAIMEAIAGQIYLAVVIARLVALQIMQPKTPSSATGSLSEPTK